MTSLSGMPVLTAAAVRAAEGAAIAAGGSVDALMAQAGEGVASWVARLAADRDVLILCGPGNNGGDGYVAAARLRDRGLAVRVAVIAPPKTDAAIRARAAWGGEVEAIANAAPAPVVVDALFGTGLSRPLDSALADALDRLVADAQIAVAVDLPSGVDTDTGAVLGEGNRSRFRLTLALGAVKPAHLVQPSASLCGDVRLIDLGLDRHFRPEDRRTVVASPPVFRNPDAASHKYTRGLVAVIGGDMPGASALAALGALHAGAGYVLMLSEQQHLPHAIVQRPWSREALDAALAGKRNAVIVVGPGLGRADAAAEKLDAALATEQPLVVDGDALHLLDGARLDAIRKRNADVILTPHAGEFTALFGDWSGSKVDAARAAAQRSGATVVFKGADTVIARPDRTTSIAVPGTPWLSTAGTGDVLAGAIAASFVTANTDAASAGVWLHAQASRVLPAPFTADALATALSDARRRANNG